MVRLHLGEQILKTMLSYLQIIKLRAKKSREMKEAVKLRKESVEGSVAWKINKTIAEMSRAEIDVINEILKGDTSYGKRN